MGKGDYLLRMEPGDLERVRKAARAEGRTVADFIREGIEMRLAHAGFPRSATREALLEELAGVVSRLSRGYVLVPAAEALPPDGPGSWSGIMDDGER